MKVDLNEIKTALSKATPGPWSVDEFGAVVNSNNELVQWYDGESVVSEKSDAHLIANAPEWLASLVEQVEEMQKTLEYYADVSNWGSIEEHGLFINDGGKLARQTLQSLKGGTK